MTSSHSADCGGPNGGYGQLTGSASVTVSWNPGFPLEPAPKSAVVTENISLGAAIYTQPGSATVTTDTGLAGGKTKRYSIQTQSSFTVTSPNILTKLTGKPATNFGGSLSFNYSVTVDGVTVNLYGVTDDMGTLKVLAGQKITANLFVGNSVVASSNYNWTVDSGTVFEDYHYGSVGELLSLTPADLSSPGLNFYTLKNDTVKVSCTANYLPPSDGVFTGSAVLTADSKDVASYKAIINQWIIDSGKVQLFGVSASGFAVGLIAYAPVMRGQNWTASVSLPSFANGVGKWGFGQTINTKIKAYIYGTVNNDYIPASAGTPPVPLVMGMSALDNVFPYANQTTDTGIQFITGDTPYIVIPTVIDSASVIQGERDDSFITSLMYRPPAVGAQSTTWIPLASYSWVWGITVKYQSGAYGITRLSPASGVPGPYSYTLTDIHPTWTKVFKNATNVVWIRP